MLGHFQTPWHAHPQQRLGIAALTGERHQLVVEWNDT